MPKIPKTPKTSKITAINNNNDSSSSINTSHFQVKPDYYKSIADCVKDIKRKINTNPRYKHFTQTYFTAGDVEQFQTYREAITPSPVNLPIPIDNKFSTYTLKLWEKYKNISASTVSDTFNYLFHKFKKGVFVKIADGKLKVFLPFSKKNYINEWADRVSMPTPDFFKYIQTQEGYAYHENNVNRNITEWYANNNLIRYEHPINERDTNNSLLCDFLKTLCASRSIPDLEFFINRRDFPVLKIDGTEPYSDIYDSEEYPLVSHNYEKYCPILSMVSHPKFADIPMPTVDDWARITRKEGKYFTHTYNRNFPDVKKFNTPWENRKSIAVFRGGSTGSGVDIHTNMRLKLAAMSPKDPETNEIIIDAGITEWNLRPRKLSGSHNLQTINIATLPFKLSAPLSTEEQAQYKYIINIDGHVCAYRLSLELFTGSCILLVGSKYKLWYSHLLKPYKHYIPIKSDLSDLVDKIKWCKNHDMGCKKIAQNARSFANKYLDKDGILDYTQALLINIKSIVGSYKYNRVPLSELQYEKEFIFLQKAYTISSGFNFKDNPFLCLPQTDFPNRLCYGFLKGVEYVIRNTIAKSNLSRPQQGISAKGLWSEAILSESKIIFQSKNSLIKKYRITMLGNEPYYIIDKKSTPKTIVHEAFVGNIINDIAKYIPNFCYTFGLYDDEDGSHLVTQYIPGQTLKSYINSDKYKSDEFIFILLQLILALQMANHYYGFIHNDLLPWNIIIYRPPAPVNVYYKTRSGDNIKIVTSIIPVIIDMGRSHIVNRE